jgi:hypothetical protein
VLPFVLAETSVRDRSSIGLVVTTVAREVGAITLFLLVFLLVGYLLFTLYRGFVYEFVLLPLKDWVGKKLHKETYRAYLSDLSVQSGGQSLSGIEAERMYAVVKFENLTKFYGGAGEKITTGIHFLWYCRLVILIGSLFQLRSRWLVAVVCVFLMLSVFVVDWHFEKMELLLFQLHSGEIKRTMAKILSGADGGNKVGP